MPAALLWFDMLAVFLWFDMLAVFLWFDMLAALPVSGRAVFNRR
jgi:hypothetical protein